MTSYSLKLSRFALFLVYAWFGILKLTGDSPASPMVLKLMEKTIPFMDQGLFLILFGSFEVLIGVLFLFSKFDRFALALLFIHLITVATPLVLLPGMVWTKPFVPTLEGQYIIKNILILASAFHIWSARRS